MVGKLIKHEFIGYSKIMLPIQIVVLGIAFLLRFVQFFETDSVAYDIVFVSAVIAMVISNIVLLVSAWFYSIKRFYGNLFTNEGYLSFTLPVTPAQHIISKLIVSVSFFLLSLVTSLLSVCVATVGEVLVELIKAATFLAGKYFDFLGGHGILYIVELIVGAIVLIGSSTLLFYACIAIGQMAKKNRIFAAFGAYFVYYLITQVIGTVFVIIISTCYEYIPFDMIENFTVEHPFATVHIFILFFVVFYALLGLLYFVVTNLVIKKKLNLE